jgi:hypothetical protein
MHRLAVALVVALALLVLAAVPALGASGPVETTTQHQHGAWIEPAENPATGNTVEVSFDGNLIDHLTFFPASDLGTATWGETATIWFVDNGVTYSGRATSHGTSTVNRHDGGNYTLVLTVHAMGSDGSSVWGHQTTHMTYNANGVVTASFDKLSFD